MIKWVVENLYWMISSLISATTIVFVVINTNKQIKNQNKESHRPYLTIVETKAINSKEFVIISGYNLSHKLSKDGIETNILFDCVIENIGYGVATNIHIIGIGNTNACLQGIEDRIFSTYDLRTGLRSTIKMIINGKFTEDIYALNLLLFYTDLNENIYCAWISLAISDRQFLDCQYYSLNSAEFHKNLSRLKINYKKQVRQYKNTVLRNNKNKKRKSEENNFDYKYYE